MSEELIFESRYSLEEIEDNFHGFNIFNELVKSLGEAKMKNNLYCYCNLCGKEFNQSGMDEAQKKSKRFTL